MQQCQSILARVRTTVLTFVHLHPCKHFTLTKARATIKVHSSCQNRSSRDCQTRKSRAASRIHSAYAAAAAILVCLLLPPSCLQRERSLVLMLATMRKICFLTRSMFFVVIKLLEQSLWGEGAVTLYRFLQNLLARGIPARHHRENWSNSGHKDTHRK